MTTSGDEMIRKRLRAGGIPSLPELYPGEKNVESVEITRASESTSLDEPIAEPSFLETGRITLDAADPAAEDAAADDSGSSTTRGDVAD